MQIFNIFNVSYWFNQPDPARGWLLWLFVGFFLLFAGAGIAGRIAMRCVDDRINKEIMRRASQLWIVMGLLGLVWLFFRQQVVPLFAWRLWLLVWILGLVWWAASIFKYLVKRVPQIRLEHAERAKMEKYLPRTQK